MPAEADAASDPHVLAAQAGGFVASVASTLLSLVVPVGATGVQSKSSPPEMPAVHVPTTCSREPQSRGICDPGSSENAAPMSGNSDDVIFLIAAGWIVSVSGLCGESSGRRSSVENGRTNLALKGAMPGAISGAAGTGAMDLVWFGRFPSGGGEGRF
jgi:hypothetical protein